MIHKVIISWDDEEIDCAETWEDFLDVYILDEMHRCIEDMDLSENTINHAHGIVDKIMLHLNTYVDAQTTVDAEPVRHGRWVEEVTDDGKGFPLTEYTCPFCQYKTRADTNYCPECGARLSEDGITK